jgi:hypothetical protein
MSSQGCVFPDGTLDLNCAREKVLQGVCPCTKLQDSKTVTIPVKGCSDDASSVIRN